MLHLKPRSRQILSALAIAAVVATLAVGLAPAVPASAVPTASRTVELVATQVGYTSTNAPETNSTNAPDLRVSKSVYATYLSFPTVTLAAGEKVSTAQLVLHVTRASHASKGGLRARLTDHSWTPEELTRATAPHTTSGDLNASVRARTGAKLTLKLEAKSITAAAGSGISLRLRYTSAGASVRLARSNELTPKVRLTITGTPPAAAGDAFGVAVIPDTQSQVMSDDDTRFADRTRWIVAARDRLNLKYVLHTGDIVNWGWLDPAQFSRAVASMAYLQQANIPYSITIGNHDTEAVGWDGQGNYGGGAYVYNPECIVRLGQALCDTKILVRRTSEFNANFPVDSIQSVGGVFEQGKVDNMWTTFSAGDTRWLVLTLELWPRKSVVAWAKDVVASHPHHNVIIETHSYLTAAGKIGSTNGGYGATSPGYLYDQIVSKYSNVKLVFSGHTGGFLHRVDRPSGNTVLSFLGNELPGRQNPVRVLSINAVTGEVSSEVRVLTNGSALDQSSAWIAITR